jgi:hypothetical protein
LLGGCQILVGQLHGFAGRFWPVPPRRTRPSATF